MCNVYVSLSVPGFLISQLTLYIVKKKEEEFLSQITVKTKMSTLAKYITDFYSVCCSRWKSNKNRKLFWNEK